jgi:hypothetical protein
MKHLFGLLLIAFMVGDCIQLTKGVFAGSKWTITAINKGGTYDLRDKDKFVLRGVRQSYLAPCEPERKRDNWGR